MALRLSTMKAKEMNTKLTEKQKAFCEIKLRTILTNTKVRGIVYDSFYGTYTVRDLQGGYIQSFTNFDEAIAELLVVVHGFNPPEQEVIYAVISYLGCDKFLR
jgi:hypothetical protein